VWRSDALGAALPDETSTWVPRGGSETSIGEMAVSCRPRETKLEAAAACGGEERQPMMMVSGVVAMVAHRQISAA
jgi:hypothetical protein